MITGSFVEPGTGLTMDIMLWYVISDSGSAYTDKGFVTPEEAVAWAKRSGEATVDVWESVNPQNGIEEAGGCIVARGLDLLCFWRCSDPAMLQECNE